MIDTTQIPVAYCLTITERDGDFFKYEGDQYRQFREALVNCYRALTLMCPVGFVAIDDLQEDGVFQRYYTLVGDTGERLEFQKHEEAYRPQLIVNRVKDRLYAHPAARSRPWKIYNHPEIAKYGDKTVTAHYFNALTPESLVINDSSAQQQEIDELFKRHDALIIKPVRENGGRGIRKVTDRTEIAADTPPFILQEFIETSEGFEGVVGRHDVRLYVIDSQLALMSVRQPKRGEFLANTSQGGSIAFLSETNIPAELRIVADQIIDQIKHICYNYFISLDFFKSNGRWLLIEINDQPGVPALYQTPEAEGIYELFAKSVKGMLYDNQQNQ